MRKITIITALSVLILGQACSSTGEQETKVESKKKGTNEKCRTRTLYI